MPRCKQQLVGSRFIVINLCMSSGIRSLTGERAAAAERGERGADSTEKLKERERDTEEWWAELFFFFLILLSLSLSVALLCPANHSIQTQEGREGGAVIGWEQRHFQHPFRVFLSFTSLTDPSCFLPFPLSSHLPVSTTFLLFLLLLTVYSPSLPTAWLLAVTCNSPLSF